MIKSSMALPKQSKSNLYQYCHRAYGLRRLLFHLSRIELISRCLQLKMSQLCWLSSLARSILRNKIVQMFCANEIQFTFFIGRCLSFPINASLQKRIKAKNESLHSVIAQKRNKKTDKQTTFAERLHNVKCPSVMPTHTEFNQTKT